MPQPAPDPASDAAEPRPIDNLDDVRLLLPLLRDLPNRPASAAALLASLGSVARAVHASPAHLAACDPSLADAAPLHPGETFTSVHRARRFVAALVGDREQDVLGALLLTARPHLLRSVVRSEGTCDRVASLGAGGQRPVRTRQRGHARRPESLEDLGFAHVLELHGPPPTFAA